MFVFFYGLAQRIGKHKEGNCRLWILKYQVSRLPIFPATGEAFCKKPCFAKGRPSSRYLLKKLMQAKGKFRERQSQSFSELIRIRHPSSLPLRRKPQQSRKEPSNFMKTPKTTRKEVYPNSPRKTQAEIEATRERVRIQAQSTGNGTPQDRPTSIPVIVEPIDADGYVRPYVRTKVSDAEHAHSIAMRLLRKDSRLAAVGIFHAEFDSTLAYLYRSDFNAAVAQELQRHCLAQAQPRSARRAQKGVGQTPSRDPGRPPLLIPSVQLAPLRTPCPKPKPSPPKWRSPIAWRRSTPSKSAWPPAAARTPRARTSA